MNHQDTKAPRATGPSELHDFLAHQIVDGAFAVHSTLGPGLLESVYQQCLVRELRLRDLKIAQQVILPIEYRGLSIDAGLRLDLLVGGIVIVEIKAVERLLPVHEAQLLTYLKLAQKRLGILVNFNVPLIKDGLRRLAL
jgi:GxxExxY protein